MQVPTKDLLRRNEDWRTQRKKETVESKKEKISDYHKM